MGVSDATITATVVEAALAKITGVSFGSYSTVFLGVNPSDSWVLTWHDDGEIYAESGDGYATQNLRDTSATISRLGGSPPSYASSVDLWYEPRPGAGWNGQILFSYGGDLWFETGNSVGWTGETWGRSTNDGANFTFQPSQTWVYATDDTMMAGVIQFGPGYTALPAELDASKVYAYYCKNPGVGANNVTKPLYLARCTAGTAMYNKANWEWLTSVAGPTWGAIGSRVPVIADLSTETITTGDGPGWYPVLVTYFPMFEQYVMTSFSNFTSRLQIFVADHPQGPWTMIHDEANWIDSHEKFTLSIIPNTISVDGTTCWAFFSGYPEWDGCFIVPLTFTTSTAPVAVDDNIGNLDYNTGDVFVDVLANDTYTGTPVLSILSQTPTNLGASVVTGGSPGILIPTGTLGAKSVTYRLADDVGTSVATITAAVVSTGPVAVDDNVGNITYNTGDVFVDVLANDTYTGTPALSILSQTPTGLGASVVTGGSPGILIPTGTLGAKSVTYRLIDDVGFSDATITATVVEAGAVQKLGSWPLSETSGNASPTWSGATPPR